MDNSLIFIKLGGSLITDKSSPGVVRREIIDSACREIQEYLARSPEVKLILGHGSGSFGHVPAEVHRTRAGVTSSEGWRGFAEVWQQAARLNWILSERMAAAGIPVISFPPSATVTARNRAITRWETKPILYALNAGLVAVTYGDVVFDEALGGTVLSTEDLFDYLARTFSPARILLAGNEEGVWLDFPARSQLIRDIKPEDLESILPHLGSAEGFDVTGGMAEKVRRMAVLVGELPSLEAVIFSGARPENFREALSGGPIGTRIASLPRGRSSD